MNELMIKQSNFSGNTDRSQSDIIKSRAAHGIHITYREELAPTQIIEGQSLTGKVVGMGLENELYDKRYLIIEGTDGKAHYIQATNSIVRAHDQREFKNGNVITIDRTSFTNENDERISYLRVENNHSLSTMLRDTYSKLDDDVINFVKLNGRAPEIINPNTCFAHEYSRAMVERYDEFNQARILYHDESQQRIFLAYDWEQKYNNLMEKRNHAYNQERNLEYCHDKTYEKSTTQQIDRTLENKNDIEIDNNQQIKLNIDNERSRGSGGRSL